MTFEDLNRCMKFRIYCTTCVTVANMCIRAYAICMKNGIIRTSAMREKKKETARVRYSAAYPTVREFGRK